MSCLCPLWRCSWRTSKCVGEGVCGEAWVGEMWVGLHSLCYSTNVCCPLSALPVGCREEFLTLERCLSLLPHLNTLLSEAALVK